MDLQKNSLTSTEPLIHLSNIKDCWFKVSLDNGLDWMPLGEAASPELALSLAEDTLQTALSRVQTMRRKLAHALITASE